MPHFGFLKRAAIVLFLGTLAACGSDSDDNDTIQDPGPGQEQAEVDTNRLYLLTAPEGVLNLDADADGERRTGTLELRQLSSRALWYADRPSRDTGSRPVADYLTLDWAPTYGQTPPNATLQFHTETQLEGLYLSLSQPSYNRDNGTARFQVQVLDETVDGPLPAQLTLSKLSLNILNNSQDDKEVSSYVQHAARASLQAGTTDSGHKLVLHQTHDEMFWVDNAPGTYADRRPISEFVQKWNHEFGENLPNAALVGSNAAGELKVYFATLGQPEYEPAAGRLSYTVRLLEGSAATQAELSQAVLLIDSNKASRFPFPGKGTAYQAFGQGYAPATANTTYIYFGSDIARKQAGSLWGTQSYLQESCATDCRNDLKTMKDMGINLIRLYDWDTRNDHSQFLNYAHELGIKVLVPISNWLAGQSPATWAKELPAYFSARNFGNTTGKDWHPAIAGVIITNELDPPKSEVPFSNALGLTAAFIEYANSKGFSKSMMIGIPVTFTMHNQPYPFRNTYAKLVISD